MTDEDKALVERLRDEAAMIADDVFQSNPETLDDAADRIEAQATEIEKLREALVWADLKIRSLPHTDQSDVEPIRAALGETK